MLQSGNYGFLCTTAQAQPPSNRAFSPASSMPPPGKQDQAHSLLSLVALADNFCLADSSEPLVPWTLPGPDGAVVGLLKPEIVALLSEEAAAYDIPEWVFLERSGEASESGSSTSLARVTFAGHLSTPARRSATMKALCERWRDTDRFAEVIGPKKWRGEMYPIYRDPFGQMFVNGEFPLCDFSKLSLSILQATGGKRCTTAEMMKGEAARITRSGWSARPRRSLASSRTGCT